MKIRVFLSVLMVIGALGVVAYQAQQTSISGGARGVVSDTEPAEISASPIFGDELEPNRNETTSAKSKPLTLGGEIEDAGERAAYEALFRRQKAADRRATARAFVERYPQSAFLSQAYEIAAKASLELEDIPSAVRFGRESLRILPENPLLLVPIADAETQQGNLDVATHDATLALECLDEFVKPALYSDKDWRTLVSQLRATSYYVLGKAATEQGLRAAGQEREERLRAAEDFTAKALRMNPADSGAAYLLGLIRLSRGNPAGAAGPLALVYERGGTLQPQAQKHLQEIYGQWPGSRPQPRFDEFVREQAKTALPTEKAEVRDPPRPPSGPAPAYVGSQACQSCHAREYSGWQNSGHAKMFRPYKFENVFGDFDNATYADESGKVEARFSHDEANHYFDVLDNQGKWHHYRVDYTIGSKWQQTYAIRLPNGEIQVMPLQYNRDQKRWAAFWKSIDLPHSERAQVPNFPNFSPETAYLLHCGPCHTSQLRVKSGRALDPKELTIAEGGVNCEMCHGPGGDHVGAMRQAKPGDRAPLRLQVEYGKLSSRDYVAICAQCHLQSAILTLGPTGEVNYRHLPDTFYVHYQKRPYGELALRSYYRDGRFRVIAFAVESFLRSKCYLVGHANCGHCHDFHPSDSANIRSLKFVTNPDQMCLQCHPAFSAKIEAHTHHAAGSEGSRCTACHMPKIMNSVMFKTMTHQLDDIPDAEMTARFGQEHSPNACLVCHRDKDVAWLQTQLGRWKSASTASDTQPGQASPPTAR